MTWPRSFPGTRWPGVSGRVPAAARADLFLGRPWAICPAPETSAAATAAVTALASGCGAQPVRMLAADHDRWVALVSHIPHLVAAAMAARLELAADDALALAGPGLRDVTRIAAGDAGLWTQILAANAAHAASLLPAIAADLTAAAAALAGLAEGDEEVRQAPDRPAGARRSGGSADPGQAGRPARGLRTVVQVVIGDQPGELARVFQAAGDAGINIEDVRIEHSPGLPAGVLELSVRPEAAAGLTAALAAGGWPVRR